MAKDEKPRPYEPRIQDTKGRAQRLDLYYLHHAHWFRTLRRRLILAAPLVVALGLVPYFWNLKSSKRVFASGPVSRAHSIFEGECRNCHSTSFEKVSDEDCKRCHDGPQHHPSQQDIPRCATCHVEHRGNFVLADVADSNCTRCHDDLKKHGVVDNLVFPALSIGRFAPGDHPDFPLRKTDDRPLKMNHAAHLPPQTKVIRKMQLPLKCSDCHKLSAKGSGSSFSSMQPVTFQESCAACHAREMEFDVLGVLGPHAPPAPHAKDTHAIRDYVVGTFRAAIQKDPSLLHRPLGAKQIVISAATPEAWVESVSNQSLGYLFDRKCVYCHEIESKDGIYPVVRKVNQISGQFIPTKPAGQPWLPSAQFDHKVHRMMECIGCHTTAAESTQTSDILIPNMNSCLPCHGFSESSLDHCAQCHTFHDKSRVAVKDGLSLEELIGAKGRR